MRVQFILWSLTAGYFGGIGVIYLLLSREPAGTAMLLIACAFGGLIAGWLWNWQRHNPVPASDDAAADVADEAGVVGIYTTDSIRPLALALAFSGIWAGLVIGLWLTGTGLALLASQIALIVRDTDR